MLAWIVPVFDTLCLIVRLVIGKQVIELLFLIPRV